GVGKMCVFGGAFGCDRPRRSTFCRAGESSVRAGIIKKDVNAMAWRTVLTLMLAVATAYATSSGGPIKRTGAAVDGGLTCLQCHNQFAPPVNQGAGRVLVSVNAYTPGFTYSLNVQVT